MGRITFLDVAYDSRGFPHEKLRYGYIKNGRLIKGKGVSRLPKGWSWKKVR